MNSFIFIFLNDNNLAYYHYCFFLHLRFIDWISFLVYSNLFEIKDFVVIVVDNNFVY
jgi:hypothetical protein